MSLLTEEFAHAAAKARPPHWQRAYLLEWKQQQTPMRLASDAAMLENIFKAAQRSPVARAALAWANAHDIEFVIDRTTDIGGYYSFQTGVVAISHSDAQLSYLARFKAVDVLVHEIRHAWQDHHKLLPYVQDYRAVDLARMTIQQALYEADAYAHGKLAAAQCCRSSGDPRLYLQKYFFEWYTGFLTRWYGEQQRDCHGARLGVPGCLMPDSKIELTANIQRELRVGLDPWRREDIEKLGKSFADVNYLSGWNGLLPDALWSRALSPSSALSHFSRVSRGDKTAEAIRIQQARQRILQAHTLADIKPRLKLPR